MRSDSVPWIWSDLCSVAGASRSSRSGEELGYPIWQERSRGCVRKSASKGGAHLNSLLCSAARLCKGKQPFLCMACSGKGGLACQSGTTALPSQMLLALTQSHLTNYPVGGDLEPGNHRVVSTSAYPGSPLGTGAVCSDLQDVGKAPLPRVQYRFRVFCRGT